jgi:hypothetical protein
MTPAIIIMIVGAFLIAVTDIFLAIKYGFEGTFSWQLYMNAKRFPILPFALGVLVGHLFWSQIYS